MSCPSCSDRSELERPAAPTIPHSGVGGVGTEKPVSGLSRGARGHSRAPAPAAPRSYLRPVEAGRLCGIRAERMLSERSEPGCHVAAWMGLIHFRCSAEGLATCSANPYLTAMETLASWSPVPELEVNSVERREPGWLVALDSRESASCPECGTQSSSRHSSYLRTLQDLSTQGTLVTIQARVTRWRCRNEQCGRRIFAERLPTLAAPFARRTARFAGIVRLFGHSTGGRPSERLLARLGMPERQHDSTSCKGARRSPVQSCRGQGHRYR